MRTAMWRRGRMALRVGSVVAVAAVTLLGAAASDSVPGDEIEEIMRLEEVTLPASHVPVTNKASLPPESESIPVPAAAKPEPAERPPAAAAVGSAAATEFASLPSALAEIERLKGEVRALQSQNRREKINAHYNMGCVYKVCGQPRLAEQEFLKVLAIDPDDAGTHYNLGILYDDSLRNRTKAKYHYQRFVELAPQDPDAGNVQAWLMSLK